MDARTLKVSGSAVDGLTVKELQAALKQHGLFYNKKEKKEQLRTKLCKFLSNNPESPSENKVGKASKSSANAGKGHILGAGTDFPRLHMTLERSTPAQEAKLAALKRLEQQVSGLGIKPNNNLRREVLTENGYSKVEVEAGTGSQKLEANEPPPNADLSVQGIFYTCSVIGSVLLPAKEMLEKIREHCEEQCILDPMVGASVMFVTANKGHEKLQRGLETLLRYAENNLKQPPFGEFRHIRIADKEFQDWVVPLAGVEGLMTAAGFTKVSLPNDGDVDDDYEGGENDDEEDCDDPDDPDDDEEEDEEEEGSNVDKVVEHFYLQIPDNKSVEKLLLLIKQLQKLPEPIVATIDRDIKVFRPSAAIAHFNLPDVFFNRTAKEVRDEYMERMNNVDRSKTVRTKHTQKLDEQGPARKYLFSVLRIRMPGPDHGVVLQGTFGAWEKMSAVEAFVRENLESKNLPFALRSVFGTNFNNPDGRLKELDLAPASILDFQPLSPIEQPSNVLFLKEGIMTLIRDL